MYQIQCTHCDVGSLLATHQAVTKHSSGLVIVGETFSLVKRLVVRSRDYFKLQNYDN